MNNFHYHYCVTQHIISPGNIGKFSQILAFITILICTAIISFTAGQIDHSLQNSVEMAANIRAQHPQTLIDFE